MKPSARALGLDLQNEWVWRGKQHLSLRPKAFAVLRYLAEHPGRLVTKAEIMHAVWPDTVVGDEALTACIREIRKELGDKARGSHYIETVHRRGYRFIGAIRGQESGVRDWVDTPSIAVLPFTNLSGDPEQEYFSDGLTEVLTSDLSQLSGLFVIARHSAFTYKGKAVQVQKVGRELGVRYVLEGSVLKSGDRVRITAQLVDATTGYYLWTERYDRPLKDIFALQDEIVQKIVTTLKLQLTLWEQGILVRKSTDNLEAYDYYLRGLEYHFRFTQEAFAQARHMYEKAIELDPKYAAAYASLGWTYVAAWAYQWSQDPRTLERAFELAQRAVALDDSLPIAHSLLGRVHLSKKRHEQAIAEAERAIALDPNYAEGYANLARILAFAADVRTHSFRGE